MTNILTEKDIFITPNTNVSRESMSRWVKNLAEDVNKALENNSEAYLIKLHLPENASVEWLGIFVKQLKQLIDEILDTPYIIIPVGGNCPLSDVTISKIVKTMQKKHMIIWFIINLIASLIAPLIFSFAVANGNAVLKIYMPFIFVIVGISWIAEFVVYIGSEY